jgi:pimeloyl-ACP methyl ester carboxylesterase
VEPTQGNLRPPPPVVEAVTSRDGTRLGYLRQGSGPGIVLVQGAMADVHAYSALAAELSTSFTVISAERRGRGLSPRPYDSGHDIARDVEDLDTIMGATGATTLFGLSSGAVITLEATRTLDRVERAVVYEPPFYEPPLYEHGIDRAGIARLHADIERGDLASALIDSLLTAGTAPALLRRAPRPVTRMLARVVLAVDGRRHRSSATLRSLLPGVRYDFHDVAGVDGHLKTFASITEPVLLLSGTRSPAFLRAAARTLHALLPRSRHHELDGLGHDGPWNDGDPAAVARVVRDFLQESS